MPLDAVLRRADRAAILFLLNVVGMKLCFMAGVGAMTEWKDIVGIVVEKYKLVRTGTADS